MGDCGTYIRSRENTKYSDFTYQTFHNITSVQKIRYSDTSFATFIYWQIMSKIRVWLQLNNKNANINGKKFYTRFSIYRLKTWEKTKWVSPYFLPQRTLIENLSLSLLYPNLIPFYFRYIQRRKDVLRIVGVTDKGITKWPRGGKPGVQNPTSFQTSRENTM